MSGPWTVERDGQLWRVSRPGAGISLLRATREDADKACHHENTLWAKKLMRDAAPDMLAALKHAINIMDSFAMTALDNKALEQAYDKRRAEAIAAIAKAEGR